MIIVNVKVSREHYKLDESELDRYRSSCSMSSVTDVWNDLSMSERLYGFHVVDAVCVDLSMSERLYGFHVVDAMCVVDCFVFGLIRYEWIFPDLGLASGGGTQGSGLKIPGLNLVFVVSNSLGLE